MSTATFNFFNNVAFAILIVYLVRHLGMSPLTIGITFSLASAGSLVAAFFAGRIGTRLGIGRTILAGTMIDALPLVLVPLAPRSLAIPFIAVAFAVVEFGVVLYNVSVISLTQALTPERLLGRVNASRRFIVWGTIPVGSLVSGALASTIGLRPTLFVGTLGASLAVLPIALSQVRNVREIPPQPEELPLTDEALTPAEAAGLSPESPSA
jgi:predicted MFS family arabinose efflux permease